MSCVSKILRIVYNVRYRGSTYYNKFKMKIESLKNRIRLKTRNSKSGWKINVFGRRGYEKYKYYLMQNIDTEYDYYKNDLNENLIYHHEREVNINENKTNSVTESGLSSTDTIDTAEIMDDNSSKEEDNQILEDSGIEKNEILMTEQEIDQLILENMDRKIETRMNNKMENKN